MRNIPEKLALPLQNLNGIAIVDANNERICTLNQSRVDRHNIGDQLSTAPTKLNELIDEVELALIDLENNSPETAAARLLEAISRATL